MKLITHDDLRRLKGIRWSRRRLDYMIHAQAFPRPIRLQSSGSDAWIESEIDAWIAGVRSEFRLSRRRFVKWRL